MVGRTRNTISFAELRYAKLGSLQCPVGGGNRRLQDKEIAIASGPLQSCSSICPRRHFPALQLQFLSIAAPPRLAVKSYGNSSITSNSNAIWNFDQHIKMGAP
jgi:hypothetical protein